MLAPAEFAYARGLVQATMLMAYSRVPAFVPDYRFVLWRERYRNRMALYCFLFPGYPNLDYPFGDRACEEDLEPDPSLVELLEPRLRTAVLPVYGVAFAGAPAKPFSNHLKEASARYGWPLLAQQPNAALVRTLAAGLPGAARVTAASKREGILSIRLEVDKPGRHVLLLGGRRLSERAPAIVLDGRPLDGCRRSANWASCTVEIGGGVHVLELPSLDSGPDPQADYLYFLELLHAEEAPRYVRLP
jgi:hypothetical protein